MQEASASDRLAIVNKVSGMRIKIIQKCVVQIYLFRSRIPKGPCPETRGNSCSSTGTGLHHRNHLGFGKHAAKSTLADANTKRDYRIFEEFAYKVIAEAQRFRIVDIFDRGYNDFKPMKWKHLINRYYQP